MLQVDRVKDGSIPGSCTAAQPCSLLTVKSWSGACNTAIAVICTCKKRY